MGTISHGLLIASFYNPDDGTVVQCNSLAADACEFEQDDAEADRHDPTGGAYYAGDVSTLRIRFKDSTGSLFSQLETWKNDGTRISAVVAGKHKNVQWYERDRISVLKPVPIQGRVRGQADLYDIELRRTGHGTHNIHGNTNLLDYLGWKDENSDNTPDNYTTGLASSSGLDFSSGVFSFFGDTGGGAQFISKMVVFPIEGLTFTISTDVQQLHDDGNTLQAMYGKDFSGTNLVVNDSTVIAQTGRASIEITTPANLYKVNAYPVLVSGVTTLNSKLQVADPALRLDGSDQYVAQ